MQNPIHSVQQAANTQIGRRQGRRLVSVIDKNSPTAGGAARFDVASAVANHNATWKVDAMCLPGAQQQPRLWLAAIAAICVIMRAHVKVVEAEARVERLI